MRDKHGVKSVYHPCDVCGTVGIVRLHKGQPRTQRCKKCANIGVLKTKQSLENAYAGRMYTYVGIRQAVRRARLVIAQSLGLEVKELVGVVHHIDGNKMNDDISNLQLMSESEHMELHKNGLKRWEKRVR